jgi:hypothetical protein
MKKLVKDPLVHQRRRDGSYGASCRKSKSGKGIVTSIDETEVTCPKCIARRK